MTKEETQTWELVREMMGYCGNFSKDMKGWRIKYKKAAVRSPSENWYLPVKYWAEKILEIWDTKKVKCKKKKGCSEKDFEKALYSITLPKGFSLGETGGR